MTKNFGGRQALGAVTPRNLLEIAVDTNVMEGYRPYGRHPAV